MAGKSSNPFWYQTSEVHKSNSSVKSASNLRFTNQEIMSQTPFPSTWEKRINGYAAQVNSALPSMSFDGPKDQAQIAPSNFGDQFPSHGTISGASTMHFPPAAQAAPTLHFPPAGPTLYFPSMFSRENRDLPGSSAKKRARKPQPSGPTNRPRVERESR